MIGELFKKYREQIVYLFFGVMTTVVSWVSYLLLTNTVLGFDDLSKTIANAISWMLAVDFAFFTNKFFVFQSKEDGIFREFVTFLGARALSGIVENGGFALLVGGFKLNDIVVRIVISVFVVVMNYVLSKFLIFKK